MRLCSARMVSIVTFETDSPITKLLELLQLINFIPNLARSIDRYTSFNKSIYL